VPMRKLYNPRMAKFFDALLGEHMDFINAQKMFFVGTCNGDGSVNISPKGGIPVLVLDANRVAYLGLHGSGNRTADDIIAGSSVTMMFCSFDKKPQIMRLFCNGEAHAAGTEAFNGLVDRWDARFHKKARHIFVLHITKVQVSCGYGVPEYEYVGDKKEFGVLLG